MSSREAHAGLLIIENNNCFLVYSYGAVIGKHDVMQDEMQQTKHEL